MHFKVNSCTCGNLKKPEILFVTADFNFNTTTKTAKILRCKGCNSIFPEIFPEINSLKNSYENYYTSRKISKTNFFRYYLKIFLIGKKNIIRYVPQKSRYILDYGCGSGEFITSLNLFFEAKYIYGTDLVKPDKPHFNWISHGMLFKKSITYFDWITLNHVVEHVYSPEILLKKLKKTLGQEGGIFIATPNANSFLISLFKEYARDIDFPRHKIIFSKNYIKSILDTLNFNVKFLEPPRIFVIFNYLSSLRNLIKSKTETPPKKIIYLIKSFFLLVFFMISFSGWRSSRSPEIYLIATPK